MDIIYAIWVSAIATVVIAGFTIGNFWLVSKIKTRDDEFRQQVSDLYQGIVISNMIDPNNLPDSTRGELIIKWFKEFYTGNTVIFK